MPEFVEFFRFLVGLLVLIIAETRAESGIILIRAIFYDLVNF